MHTITLNEILSKYEEILDGKVTREEAEAFADGLIKLEDDYSLVYVPKTDEEMIWEEVLFLSGINMQDKEPQVAIKSYLHDEENIKNHIKTIEDYKNNKK